MLSALRKNIAQRHEQRFSSHQEGHIRRGFGGVTDSNLDQLVQGHFATLELLDDLDLINGLNMAKDWLIDNREKLNTKEYDPNIDALEVEH